MPRLAGGFIRDLEPLRVPAIIAAHGVFNEMGYAVARKDDAAVQRPATAFALERAQLESRTVEPLPDDRPYGSGYGAGVGEGLSFVKPAGISNRLRSPPPSAFTFPRSISV